jgi:hypothetical protein
MSDGLSRAEIARAVPAGSRRIRSQREALRCGLACPDLDGARSDLREHLRDWWRIHVHHASWGGQGRPPRGTTEPTRARVCQLAGMSESTYKACRRWWESRGYIAIVRPGWTPALRAAVLASPGDHNIRQAYVLCLPRKTSPAPRRSPARTLSRPLSQSRRDLDRIPAREAPGPGSQKTDKTSAPRSPVLYRGPLAGLTDGWWAHITAPFAAWCAADLVHAVDHLPGGRQHRTRIADLRHPVGWLRWRLSHWLRADGTPLPSPAQERAEAALRHREYLAGRERDAEFVARREQLRRRYRYDTADDAPAPDRPRADAEPGRLSMPGDWARLARTLLAVRDDRVRDAIVSAWLQAGSGAVLGPYQAPPVPDASHVGAAVPVLAGRGHSEDRLTKPILPSRASGYGEARRTRTQDDPRAAETAGQKARLAMVRINTEIRCFAKENRSYSTGFPSSSVNLP